MCLVFRSRRSSSAPPAVGHPQAEGNARHARAPLEVVICVGGVISPLLANIYINRMLKAFEKNDLMKRCGALIVNYADDFVVLSGHSAAAVLAQVRRWIVGMKLELNEAKTCLRDAWKESFRFLGYEFGPLVYQPTGTRYLGARPSKKAMEQVRQRVSEILWRGRTARWQDICRELNQYLTGWAAYFAYDTAYPSFRIVDIHVAARARNFLRRRHKLPSRTARFGYVEVHHDLGVVEIRGLLRSHASE
jgi:RNA-directed DNA polymerase